MSKTKDSSEVEHLRGENRQLKKLINHLKKEVARGNKKHKKDEALLDNFVVPVEEEKVDGMYVVPQENTCPKCANKIQEISLGSMGTLQSCIDKKCGYRKRIK